STITGCFCAAAASPVTGSPVSGQVEPRVEPAATFCAFGASEEDSFDPSPSPHAASAREAVRTRAAARAVVAVTVRARTCRLRSVGSRGRQFSTELVDFDGAPTPAPTAGGAPTFRAAADGGPVRWTAPPPRLSAWPRCHPARPGPQSAPGP